MFPLKQRAFVENIWPQCFFVEIWRMILQGNFVLGMTRMRPVTTGMPRRSPVLPCSAISSTVTGTSLVVFLFIWLAMLSYHIWWVAIRSRPGPPGCRRGGHFRWSPLKFQQQSLEDMTVIESAFWLALARLACKKLAFSKVYVLQFLLSCLEFLQFMKLWFCWPINF